jgi:hypothetical protein
MLRWIVALSLIAVADPVIVLEGPASVEFSDAAGARTARLAVKPVTAKVTEADAPQVVEFTMGDLRLDQPSSPLTASWQVLKDNSPAALVLTLSEKVRRPGVYRAVIAPLPGSQPAERLTLQITIRAAKLKLPDKLIIARTIRSPFAASDSHALTVQEQTGLRASPLCRQRLWRWRHLRSPRRKPRRTGHDRGGQVYRRTVHDRGAAARWSASCG